MNRAVIYLRVSSAAQLAKGEDPDGYSIPAQREACRRKAAELGAEVVREFVDRAESARNADRPALQEMLTFIEQTNPDYVVVHKVDRLARNRVDDVEITMQLRRSSTQLVSCSENIDDTPSGMLVHGIMSVLAEYYSLNLANEVVKGSVQKAKAGGLPGKAPIGYLNVRKMEAGRENRTVEVDPIRGPLMAYAFGQYATGDVSLRALLDDLTERGLMTVGGPNTPQKTLSISQLSRLLQHPFYKGTVRYRGVEYPGSHTPLVGEAGWQKVQQVFEERRRSTQKRRVHNHYLKGTLFCGRCDSRMIVTKPTNRHGTTYEYFVCIGRHQKRTPCDLQGLPIDLVEAEVVALYRRDAPSVGVVSAIEAEIRSQVAGYLERAEREASLAEQRIKKLRDQQVKLVDAHLEGAVPIDVLKQKQRRISQQIAAAEAALSASIPDSNEFERRLQDAMAMLVRVDRTYEHASDSVRRQFNQAIYQKIHVDDDGGARGTFTETFEMMYQRAKPSEVDGLLATISDDSGDEEFQFGQGLKMIHVVGPVGLEPTTNGLKARSDESEEEGETPEID